MLPVASPPAVAAAPPPTVTEAELPESPLLPQADRISARAAVPAIHADLTARVLVIEVHSFLGALRPGRAMGPWGCRPWWPVGIVVAGTADARKTCRAERCCAIGNYLMPENWMEFTTRRPKMMNRMMMGS